MSRQAWYLASALFGALLGGAGARAELASPHPDLYDMTHIQGQWLYSTRAAAQGRDIWFLPGTVTDRFTTQCEIRVSPTDWFTPDEFVDFLLAMSPDDFTRFPAFSESTPISARERIEVDGRPAVRQEVQTVEEVRWLSVMLYHTGHIVWMMCGAPVEVFDGVRPALEDFVDEVRFASGTSASACDPSSHGGKLSLAINLGCPDVVSDLLARGADPNRGDHPDHPPMQLAAAMNDARIIRLLVAAGAKVDVRGLGDGTPLLIAATEGHAEAVRALLELHADPNVTGATTPIYAASSIGNSEIVRMLLDAGADPDTPAYAGQTPLYIAAAQGHEIVVGMLLKAGADPSVRSLHGEAPLDVAESAAVRRLLLEAQSNSARQSGRRNP